MPPVLSVEILHILGYDYKKTESAGVREEMCIRDSPKDVALFPANKTLVSLNPDSGTLTFFTTDLEKGLLVMNGPEMKVCLLYTSIKDRGDNHIKDNEYH